MTKLVTFTSTGNSWPFLATPCTYGVEREGEERGGRGRRGEERERERRGEESERREEERGGGEREGRGREKGREKGRERGKESRGGGKDEVLNYEGIYVWG